MVAYLLIIKINLEWYLDGAFGSVLWFLLLVCGKVIATDIYMQSIQKQDGQIRSLLSTDTYQRNNF